MIHWITPKQYALIGRLVAHADFNEKNQVGLKLIEEIGEQVLPDEQVQKIISKRVDKMLEIS